MRNYADSESDKRGYLHERFHFFHLRDSRAQELDFHYHEFDKLVFLLGGKVTYIVEGKSYFLKPYDILLVGRSMIHKPPVLEAVKEAGNALLGNVLRVEVVVGSAPAASAAANPPASGGDELDELLAFGQQFDNIIIKE